MRALKVLEFDRDAFLNTILLNIILEKLDCETQKQFKLRLKDKEILNFDELLELLRTQMSNLSNISSNTASKFTNKSIQQS